MLLLYTLDKNDTTSNEKFYKDVMRIDFEHNLPIGTRAKLRMIGFNSDGYGNQVFLQFPDLLSNELEMVTGDFVEEWKVPGIAFVSDSGSMRDEIGTGRFDASSDMRALDLDLGRVDHNKSYFSIIVDARRAVRDNIDRTHLNNVTVVIEMMHDSMLT